MDTDSRDTGIGAVLTQKHKGCERVVEYASRPLPKQEKKYSTTKKEFLKHFRHFYGEDISTENWSQLTYVAE